MPTTTRQPNGDSSPLQLSTVPTGGTHFSHVDETMPLKNITDHVWKGVSSMYADQYSYPADSPGSMLEVTEVDSHMYYLGFILGETGTPGIRITLYVGAVSKGFRLFNANSGGIWKEGHFRVTPSPYLSKSDYDALETRFKIIDGAEGDIPETV